MRRFLAPCIFIALFAPAGIVNAQNFTPLPPVLPSYDAQQFSPPIVGPSGLAGPLPVESTTSVPAPVASNVPAYAPASPLVATEGTGTIHATNELTAADVERIVAEYLAKREAESLALNSATAPSSPDAVNVTAPNPEWYEIGSDKKFSAQWNHGLELQTANKDFKVHLGGRIQFDTGFFSNDDFLEQPVANGGIGSLRDSMQFRRARFRADGTLYDQIEYAFEFEFLNNNAVDFAQTPALATAVPSATDLWIAFTKMPLLGTVKVGNQKNPIGFEHMESSRYLDFIERSFNQDLFYSPFNNGFSPGISAANSVFDNRATWSTGVFGANMNANTNIFGYGLGPEYAYTFRSTMLPYWEQDGRYMVHLGASIEFRDADDGRVRVRSRGNVRNGPPGPFNSVYADTTSLLADSQSLLNFEAVYQAGALLLQSEYCFSSISSATQIVGVPAPIGRGNVGLHGGYVEALYFLTGEHRAYSHERAAFDRVIPYENAFRVRNHRGCICQGLGAWQIGIRYDHADLNNSGINGGMLDAVTFGVNWFLNPNMKIQANWDWTHRGSVTRFVPALGANNTVESGDVLGFSTRLAIDF